MMRNRKINPKTIYKISPFRFCDRTESKTNAIVGITVKDKTAIIVKPVFDI